MGFFFAFDIKNAIYIYIVLAPENELEMLNMIIMKIVIYFLIIFFFILFYGMHAKLNHL